MILLPFIIFIPYRVKIFLYLIPIDPLYNIYYNILYIILYIRKEEKKKE